MSVSDIHLNSVTGVTIKKFAYTPGTNQVEVAIGEIDIDMTMDADLSALHFIPFRASAITVDNMTLDVFLEFTNLDEDGVGWHLAESSKCTFDHVGIHMNSGFLNWIVGLMRGTIDKIINNQVIPMI